MNSSNSNGKPAGSSGRSKPPAEWVTRRFAMLEAPLVAYTRRRLGGDLEAARDVVQETFVKLCQQTWPDIEAQSTAWLYKTCRNRAIDLTRREGRFKMIQTGADMTTLHDRRQLQAGDQAERGEQLQRMRTCIDQLPDQQQELLRLRLQDGLSYKQIAEVTGLTATNVGYHLHQAIVRLRGSLRDDP